MGLRAPRCPALGLAPVLVLAVLVTLMVTLEGGGPAQAASVTAPTVSGTAAYAETLTAQPGVYDPPAVSVSYQWLRDGAPIAGALAQTYRPGLDDLDHVLSVLVTGIDATGASSVAGSAATTAVARAALPLTSAPRIEGGLRFGRTLTVRPPRFGVDISRVRYQWLREGRAIDGATSTSYQLAAADVGARLAVQATASAPGRVDAVTTSVGSGRVLHRRDVRRRVTYHVETRGPITTSVAEFARLAQESYVDPRGWRGAGISFRRVARGGDFTLVLAAAAEVPRFSGGCSSTYSCRVGRFVIINQTRWLRATPPWNAAGGSLRDYRHLVVDHETGHWLGLAHAGCPRPGALAPVMMQQSKGLDGCRFNPFPTLGELARVS